MQRERMSIERLAKAARAAGYAMAPEPEDETAGGVQPGVAEVARSPSGTSTQLVRTTPASAGNWRFWPSVGAVTPRSA